MTIPLFTLLGFALWTLLLLMFTVGVYRWQLILSGKAEIHAFAPEAPTGADWYRRATRAHVNCIENLPVFASIVVVLSLVHVEGQMVDVLCCIVLGARLCQTTVHVGFVQTARAVSFRFSFFTLQLLSMLALIFLIGAHAGRN
jgi:uncharacterized membrane protein YecN with MAPEG domain